MIDWFGLLANGLWVGGLAIVLAAASQAMFLGRAQAHRAQALRPYMFAGLALVCLGLAATSGRSGWEVALWLALAAFWGARAARSRVAAPLRRLLHSRSANGVAVPRHAIAVFGLILLGTVVAALYAYTIRPWMQPDEPRHFQVALHVARLRQPVVDYPDRVLQWEQEIIADMERHAFWWYGYTLVPWDPEALPTSFDEIWSPQYGLAFFQPPIYYAVAGGLLAKWGQDWTLSQAVLNLRLLGVLLLAISLWGIYLAAAELFPGRPRLALAVLACAALWPSHLAAAAAVNNDVLVELFAVWALFMAIRILRRGPTLTAVTALLILGLLAMFTKRSGLVALTYLPLTLLLWAAGYARQRLAGGRLLLVGLAAGLASLLAAGLALAAWRAGRLYLPGDFSEALISGQYGRELADAPLASFADALLRTFVGWFGWMRVALPDPLYWAGAAMLLLAAAGLAMALWRLNPRTLAGWQVRAFNLLIVALIIQIALVVGKDVVYGAWRDGSLPQARYLYPATVSVLLPLIVGLRMVIPRPLRPVALPAGVVLLLLFNLYVLAVVLYPFFWL